MSFNGIVPGSHAPVAGRSIALMNLAPTVTELNEYPALAAAWDEYLLVRKLCIAVKDEPPGLLTGDITFTSPRRSGKTYLARMLATYWHNNQ